MQALVYLFIALAGFAIGAMTYFALSFTLAEAILVALVVVCIATLVTERRLRLRAEKRLERGIEDLSRLLATDAQAGSVLGRRINALSELNPGQRLETIEADISVLGTVIRQVAEAVAEIEEKAAAAGVVASPDRFAGEAPRAVSPPQRHDDIEPIIPLDMVRQALGDQRLVYHIQPVARLPQRRPAGYDLIPRLMLEDGDVAEPVDFLPRHGGEDVLQRVDGTALNEAVAIARRARTGGQAISLYIPLSGATLRDSAAVEQLLAILDANRVIATGLIFTIGEVEFQELMQTARTALQAIQRRGAGFSLSNASSLRLNFADLSELGVRTIRVNAGKLINSPEVYTDFHLSDIASYVGRFDITLLATGVSDERQIVELLDNEITLVQGNHVAPPGPVRPDLLLEPTRTVAPPAPQRPEAARRRAEL
ncbi:EAL domain-containing protein [Devosia sp. Root685]|uniref:EAL domain-containing protein n=1 Tax=Devosia sp. Root685 TaxID=1736587 RepID=UPI000A87A9FC|nr:EAL domain-containing protein [Devosia sp. Root685]